MIMVPRFATADDFKSYWGKDLNALLRDDDNSSDKANVFLARVEQRLMSWIDANTFRKVPYNKLTPYQARQFKFAILEQAMYMWRNGDVDMDSGYDSERGKIVDRADLNVISVCVPALNYIINAGLYNQKIQNRKRYLRGYGLGMTNEGGIVATATNSTPTTTTTTTTTDTSSSSDSSSDLTWSEDEDW